MRSDLKNWTERSKLQCGHFYFSEMSTIYFCQAMYVFVSLFDSATASVSVNIAAFEHSFSVHEEEDEYKH